MSFEQHDNSYAPDFATYTDTPEPIVDAKDGYQTTDFIPSDITCTPVDSTEHIHSKFSLPVRQINYIGGTLVDGEHTNGRVQQCIEALRQSIDADIQNTATFLANTPHRLNTYSHLYDGVREQMTADFGPDKALMPIITLSREGFKEYVETYSAKSARASVNAPGVYTYGTVIVNALDALDSRSEFPTPENRLLVDTVRHEGVHSTMPGEEILAITRPLMEGDQNVTEQEKASGHIIIPVKVGGFLEYNPGVNFYDATGKFIEEGFSESYAVRAKSNEISQITGGAPSIMIQRPDLGFQNSIIFSDDETQKLYSAADNTIYIPWRYACDVKVRASAKNRYSAISTPDAFAAYTIDILDCALPGLYQKMIESRCNPNVKEQVKERINSVQPGLYKQLSGLALNPRGLESGLVRTVIALGLADKRVKDVLRS